jgi:hypothetical protein
MFRVINVEHEVDCGLIIGCWDFQWFAEFGGEFQGLIIQSILERNSMTIMSGRVYKEILPNAI